MYRLHTKAISNRPKKGEEDIIIVDADQMFGQAPVIEPEIIIADSETLFKNDSLFVSDDLYLPQQELEIDETDEFIDSEETI